MTACIKAADGLDKELERIMFDPISYIHPRRLRLPRALDTPRQRVVINDMLIGGLALAREAPVCADPARRLLRHWQSWPYISTLIGAQLLKQELAWRGNLLQFSAPVQFFMSLPLLQVATKLATKATDDLADDAVASMPACLRGSDVRHQVQGLGLLQVLRWQQQTPTALTGRLRLLFPAELDGCFEHVAQPSRLVDFFLISQAIQYAKNHSDHV